MPPADDQPQHRTAAATTRPAARGSQPACAGVRAAVYTGLHQLQHAQVALRVGGYGGAAGPRPAQAADKLLAARQPGAPRRCVGEPRTVRPQEWDARPQAVTAAVEARAVAVALPLS